MQEKINHAMIPVFLSVHGTFKDFSIRINTHIKKHITGNNLTHTHTTSETHSLTHTQNLTDTHTHTY